MGIATIIGLGFLNISKLSWKNFFLMSFNKKKKVTGRNYFSLDISSRVKLRKERRAVKYTGEQ